ncbi:protein FAR1-RELATED SEQUENCE 5-like [Bidens hawaiensis]|uniref:protein FAR1-RELATED SEQUENCE 5-like n=1 Tax=Bidens hawaiensis TaxID=980011 RepID=UPI004049AD3D
MYYKYAEESSFSVRKGRTKKWKGVVTHKYLRCNKYGTSQSKRSFDSLSEPSMYVRQKTFTVTDCKAHVGVSFCRETCNFILSKFVEDHNHCLVDTFKCDLTKISRKLSFSTKKFIHQMSLNRVGPTVAHRLLVSIKGGHHNVRGTPVDFKNFYNGMRIFIGDRDSQSIFWADEISKLNYKAFGHVLAFDATCQTNRYKMIFVPFTGVDHHKKCVTFGAALISIETIDSYKWLLQSFLNFHGAQTKLVLSDQDPSMRQAIVQVSSDVIENINVRSRILWFGIFWFTRQRVVVIEKFGLQDNEWLNDMFEIRDRWVPAYFREITFCCLMKTTSRCESSNAAFKVNSTSTNTLVQFMLCMESRLDGQRYSQRSCEYKTSSVSFKSTTGEEIEKHAFELYTQTIFNDVRKEIMKGKYCCYVTNTEAVDAHVLYFVTHLDKRKDITNVFLVNFDPANNSVSCSCMGFTRGNGMFYQEVFSQFQIVLVWIPILKVFYVLWFWRCFRNADAVDDNEYVFEEIIGNVNEGDDFIENPDAVRTKGCGKVRRVMGESEKIVEKAGKVASYGIPCIYQDHP